MFFFLNEWKKISMFYGTEELWRNGVEVATNPLLFYLLDC